ncbi:uncharacterized protein LOC128388504 isoform X1 [Panonychus citri]|uniref:uncharacterized protein LOC128388504 isoform X1 n=1 Tax=Panonychus citri TaxID=50023 RepID=UPI0023071677|nr:uncharacterized protein LOC128388504 isoform X1 [Panonychus citri]XP_053203888.1 uncharacterized protein LOC128388504 isoform X1 [Panonychus citri]
MSVDQPISRSNEMLLRDRLDGCLEPWQASLFAGIYASSTSIFDLLWSTANMIHETHPIIFFILLAMAIESVLFILASILLFFGLAKKKSWCFIPWMILAIIDITLDLAHNFVEISLPVSQQTACVPLVSQNVPERFLRWKRTYAAPCILALTGLLIRLFICAVMLYALYSVYRQYTLLTDGTNSKTKIKVYPANSENDNNHDDRSKA